MIEVSISIGYNIKIAEIAGYKQGVRPKYEAPLPLHFTRYISCNYSVVFFLTDYLHVQNASF